MSRSRKRAILRVEVEGDIQVLSLSGEVGGSVVRALDRALATAIDGSPRAVIVDLRQVSFIDHTSLRVLVKAWRRATARQVGFMLIRPGRTVWALFALSGLDLQLPSCFSRADALIAFKPRTTVPSSQRRAGQPGCVREALIERDLDTVFRYVAALEHSTEWRPEDFSEVVKQSPGPTRHGTRYLYVTRRHGARGEWVVNGLLSPHWLRCESPPARLWRLGQVWGSEEYVLFAKGAATQLAVTLDVHFSGPIRLIRPYLKARMERRLVDQLTRLKQRVEA
jgi:anti-sigma B factor antagonist